MKQRSVATVALDQIVYALGNFALQFAVLRFATLPELAAFAVAYATFWLVTGSSRALFGESQLVQVAKSGDGTCAPPPVTKVLAYSGLGLLAGALTTLFVGEQGRSVTIAMAAVLPIIVFADYVRYRWLAQGRVRQVLKLDCAWLVLQLILSIAAVMFYAFSASTLIYAWGLSAGLASLAFAPSLRAPVDTPPWESQTGRGMVGEFFITSGVQQALPALLFASGYTVALAALRAAQTVVSPLNTVFTAGTTISYSLASRVRGEGLRLGGVLAIVLAVGVGMYGMVVLSLPDVVATEIFGSNWELAALVIGPIVVQLVANAAATGGIVASRFLRGPGENLRRRALTAPFMFLAPLVGAGLGGAEGLGWGMAVGSGIAAMVWWLGLSERRGSV